VLACYGGAFGLLAVAVKTLPLGFVYAVWAGAGIAGATMVGVTLFGERVGAASLVGAALIVAGIVVLVVFAEAGRPT
jgi:multidrug transporter EmrE-like cation transporter